MSTWQERALKKYYFDRPKWQNGRIQFFQLVAEFTKTGSSILEIGAGPTNKTTEFLSSLGSVTGLDIDPVVKDNIHCQQTVVYGGIRIPFDDNYFDVVISDYVCEHIESPMVLMREIFRVLRPEGHYIFRTPNLLHYVSFAAKITPQWFHKRVANRLRGLTKESHDPYPTYHRMNTKNTCRKILASSGFNIKKMVLIETEPSYGLSSRFLFYPLMIWERILNASNIFQNLRSNILCAALVNK